MGWFSPTYKLLSDVWRELANTLGGVTTTRSVQEHRLELLTGGTVEFWSLDDPDPARGRKYKRVIIDEAAMVRNLADVWQMAIRPTLTDLQGDAWFLSTPKGLNYFHAMYQLGQDPLESEWASWQLPTSVNPYISLDEIEAARHQLPERVFGQEYLAEFLVDGAGVFRRVGEAAVLEPGEPQKDRPYVMGVDWGKMDDFTVLSVIDGKTKQQVALDRFNQIDYHFQLGRLKVMYDRWHPQVIVAERNSIGEPLIEQLHRLNLPVWGWTATNASKAEAIEALSLAFEKGDLKILKDRVQHAELVAYESERLPSGMLRYGAPDGLHDDTVMALAMAWLIARQSVDRPARQDYVIGAGARPTRTAWDPFAYV